MQEDRLSRIEHDYATIIKKLDAYAESVRLHDRRLTSQNEVLVNHASRLTSVEEERRERELNEIRREEREKARNDAVDVQFLQVDKRLGNIEGAVSRLLWIMVGSVVAAAVGFVLKGGLMP